jgi:hypothetical protein
MDLRRWWRADLVAALSNGSARRLTNDLIDYRDAGVGADGASIVSIGQDAAPLL